MAHSQEALPLPMVAGPAHVLSRMGTSTAGDLITGELLGMVAITTKSAQFSRLGWRGVIDISSTGRFRASYSRIS
jgi:hypothetical protein